jgi:predicted transposase/invertase (TIGR01784 family)
MYAGRLSLGTENDIALREKYALEILNTTGEGEYDKRQRKFILEFADRIFRLSDPEISQEVREAYKVKTMSLEQYVAEIDKAEAMMLGVEKGKVEGKVEGKFEIARSMLAHRMSVSDIVDITGLNERDILSLR